MAKLAILANNKRTHLSNGAPRILAIAVLQNTLQLTHTSLSYVYSGIKHLLQIILRFRTTLHRGQCTDPLRNFLRLRVRVERQIDFS